MIIKILLIIYILQELIFIKCFYYVTTDFIYDLCITFKKEENLYLAILMVFFDFVILSPLVILMYIVLLIPVANNIFSIIYGCDLKNPFFKELK